MTVHLQEGENTLTVLVNEGDTANINIDRIEVSREPMVMVQLPVPNGGFENGILDNWTVENLSGTAGHGVDENDAFGGSYKSYFYNGSAYEGRLSQTVTGLPDGVYRVNATVKMSNTAADTSRMELSGYNGTQETMVNIPFNSIYQKFPQK